MINSLLWLTYIVSGAIAFALVYLKAWRLVPSMILATAIGTFLSLILLLVRPQEEANAWFQVDVAINGSLSLIFAGAGAALAFALRSSRD